MGKDCMSNIKKVINIASRVQPQPIKATCKWSTAYLADSLFDEERTAFENHMAECMICQATVDNLRLMAHLLTPISDRLRGKGEA